MTRLLFGLALMASFFSASNSLAEMPDSPFSTSRSASNVSHSPYLVPVRQPDGTVRLVDLFHLQKTDKRANVVQAPKRIDRFNIQHLAGDGSYERLLRAI